MKTVRKSLAQIDSFWAMIRHDGLNQAMVLVYLALCVIFLNMKLSSSLPADQQISWLLALLPEGMLLIVLVLYLVQKVLDPLLQWLFPWPQQNQYHEGALGFSGFSDFWLSADLSAALLKSF